MINKSSFTGRTAEKYKRDPLETWEHKNKTGLQPVSRPVELVHYSEGWGVSAKSTLCKVVSCQCKTQQIDNYKTCVPQVKTGMIRAQSYQQKNSQISGNFSDFLKKLVGSKF